MWEVISRVLNQVRTNNRLSKANLFTMDIVTQKFRFSMLIHEHGHGVMVAVFQQWSPGLMNDQQLISFSFTFQSPEQELEIMSISSLLSFLFSLTVKNNSVPQVIHWTHCLLEQGCGFLGYKKVLVLNAVQMCFNILKLSMKVLKRSKSGIFGMLQRNLFHYQRFRKGTSEGSTTILEVISLECLVLVGGNQISLPSNCAISLFF